MPITTTRYSDDFENLDGQIAATTQRIEEIWERAKDGTEEQRAAAQSAIIAGAMFRIRRGSHKVDRAIGLHRVAHIEHLHDAVWTVCNCGFAALGSAPEDFTSEEFDAHPGHRDRRPRP